MSRVITYLRAMGQRVLRLRECGAGWRTAMQFAHDLTRRRLATGRLYGMRLGALPFEARVEDWVTVQEICIFDEYAFLDRLFPNEPPGVIVDLGANVGLFSLYCLSRWPAAAVHAVEASRSTYAILARNRDRHSRLNWHTHHAAVLDRNGEVSFALSDYSTTRRVADSGGARVETVPAATLKDLLDRMGVVEVDLLKMDIEGAEERVLRTSSSELGRIRRMVLELHPDVCDADAVMQVLRAAYDHVQELPRSAGGKPLVLASREQPQVAEFLDHAASNRPSAVPRADEIVEDDALARTMGQYGQRDMQRRFSLETLVDRLIDCWEMTAAGAPECVDVTDTAQPQARRTAC